jgi:molecular chaperone DnaK (HSP70)
MAKKYVKPKCPQCNGKGLLPWCPLCFVNGTITKEMFDEAKAVQDAADTEKNRIKGMSQVERIQYENQKVIERYKYLQNVKDLKKTLDSTMRSRKLLTGKPELDAHIRNILNEAIQTIHDEIELEEITSTAQVVARFNELVETPDYSHEDRTPEEVEKYLQTKQTNDGNIRCEVPESVGDETSGTGEGIQ